MYASLRRYLISASSVDVLIRRLDEVLAPAVSRQPGFVSFFALAVAEGTIETVSIFRDRESSERSDAFASALLQERLGELGLAFETISGGDVLVSRVALEALEDAQRRLSGRSHVASSPTDLSERPVLVAGATGRTGRLIVDRLLERGLSVRALVRDRAKGQELLPAGVRQYVGNVRDSRTLIEPMDGIGAVIVSTAGGSDPDNSAELVDYFGTLSVVTQAVASHVGLVVFVSTLGATRPAHSMDVEPSSLGWKARAEEIVRSAGVPYCIVRAGWLTDRPGREPLAVSQGDRTDGRISRSDLADVCAELLFIPGARGKTIDVIASREGSELSLEAAIAGAMPDVELRAGATAPPAIIREPVAGHAR